jgi:hypothetical protein
MTDFFCSVVNILVSRPLFLISLYFLSHFISVMINVIIFETLEGIILSFICNAYVVFLILSYT